jgi:hypothetical protein
MTRLRGHTRRRNRKGGGSVVTTPWVTAEQRHLREVFEAQTEKLADPMPEGSVRCDCGLVVRVRKSDGRPYAHHIRGIPCAAAPATMPTSICDGCGESRSACRCGRHMPRHR